jgi:hypothetical protein
MSSYQEILSQIEELKRKAEDVRQQEMAGAIAEIKRLMAQFGITGDDLGLSGRRGCEQNQNRGIVAPNIVIRSSAEKPGPVAVVARAGWLILKLQGKSLDDLPDCLD